MRQVNVILEIEYQGIEEALRAVESFVYSLANKAVSKCWIPHITIAGFKLFHLSTKDCYSLKCVSEAFTKMSLNLKSSKTDW